MRAPSQPSCADPQRPSPLTSSLSFILFCLSLLSLFTLSACGVASARSLRADRVSVELIDGDGDHLPTYHHRGKVYVQGEYGERYIIKVNNNGARRVEVVVTVDGRDVVNGQLGSYDHRGYVIDPYGHVRIEGFRKSDTEVATFRFTTPGDSYSGRMGSAQHVGVIGVAVFEERQVRRPKPLRPVQPLEVPRAQADDQVFDELSTEAEESAAAPAPSTSAGGGGASVDIFAETRSSAQGRGARPRSAKGSSRRRAQRAEIGTRYGEGRYSEVEQVSFVRSSSRPARLLTFHYDSERGLRRRGVIRRRPQPPAEPSAFPAEPRYAPPPP